MTTAQKMACAGRLFRNDSRRGLAPHSIRQSRQSNEKRTEGRDSLADVYVNLGSLYGELGDLEKALSAWRQCLRLNPLQEEVTLNVAPLQYSLWKSNPLYLDKQRMISRLTFVLALNPHCDKAKTILKELTVAR